MQNIGKELCLWLQFKKEKSIRAQCSSLAAPVLLCCSSSLLTLLHSVKGFVCRASAQRKGSRAPILCYLQLSPSPAPS